MLKNFVNKRIVYIFLLITIILSIFMACEKDSLKRLETPKNLKIENEMLFWDEVANATAYIIDVNGEEHESQVNSLDLFTIMNTPITYRIKVMAWGDFVNYDDSFWSETIEYKIELLNGFTLRSIKGNTEYEIASAEASKLNGKLLIPSKLDDGKRITKIANHAFENCTGITSVMIPSSIKNIGNFAFNGCSSLYNVFISDGVTEIGDYAFSGCALTKIQIPQTVTEISSTAFALCENLVSLEVHPYNQFFHSNQNCIIRDNELVIGCKTSEIPNDVTIIGEFAFFNCLGLEKITISGNVEVIKNSAFGGCKNLKQVEMLEGVKRIGNLNSNGVCEIFRNCNSITELTIPASVEQINPGFNAFCDNLTKLTVNENNSVYKSENNCIIEKATNEVVFGCKSSKIPNYAQSIGEFAFYGCDITEFSVPEGIKHIKPSAFAYSKLKRINLPDSLKTIESCTFADCKNLTEINIPNGVETIGGAAFSDCSSLTTVVIPQSVKEIGGYAFSGCYSVTVNLYETVETIGNGAFENATIYTSVKHALVGWAMGDMISPAWSNLCRIAYGCKFEYENGVPYLTEFTYKRPKDLSERGTLFSLGNPLNIPYRAGYIFEGWATKENSHEIVYKKELQQGSNGLSYVTLLPSEMYAIPADEEVKMYAVWSKN